MKNKLALLISFVACICFGACNQEPEDAPPPERPAKIDPNPSSAFLSPEESMKTMQLPPGYHLFSGAGLRPSYRRRFNNCACALPDEHFSPVV